MLIAWVLYSNGQQVLMDLRTDTGVDGLLGWLDVLAVVGVLIAVLMGREARPSRRTG